MPPLMAIEVPARTAVEAHAGTKHSAPLKRTAVGTQHTVAYARRLTSSGEGRQRAAYWSSATGPKGRLVEVSARNYVGDRFPTLGGTSLQYASLGGIISDRACSF
jgi:hypothetical protein